MASLSPSLSTENITNFRDVASTTTNASNQPTLKPTLFYRSALPSTASPSARANLSTTYKIKTILDLRTDTELGEQEKEKKQQAHPTHPASLRRAVQPATGICLRMVETVRPTSGYAGARRPRRPRRAQPGCPAPSRAALPGAARDRFQSRPAPGLP